MIALLVALVLVSADPCEGAPAECRLECRDAILTWRTTARVNEAHWEAALDRLAVRTATGAANLAVATAPPAVESGTRVPQWLGAVLGLSGGLALGVLLASLAHVGH